MKKTISILLIAVMLLGILAGCGNKNTISQDKAISIALKETGVAKKDATDLHVHVSMYQELPCYSVHIVTKTEEFEVIVDAATGEVLNTNNSVH